MFIDGFGIAGFRSFGPELVKIPDLEKVNVFIGKNNSGKSNILLFVEKFFGAKNTNMKGIFGELDYHKSGNTIAANIDIAIEWWNKNLTNVPPFQKQFPELFGHFGPCWFAYRLGKPDDYDVDLFSKIIRKYDEQKLRELTMHYVGASNANLEIQARSLANFIRPELPVGKFRVYPVPTLREITAEDHGGKDPSLCGAGLIKKLAELQQPNLGPEHDASLDKFQQITDLLSNLLGEPEAEIDIPHTKDDVYVTIRGKKLPIKSLGTGIHQVIMLAAAVTAYDNSIFCLEEPETNLHPALQKELINYLLKTKNQYFISTHSNAFIDNPKVRVYRCWLENSATKCAPAEITADKYAILDDLGCKASDILQANCVIWVEGPSDRIYLNHWIKASCAENKMEPVWVEGIHYSIMFYGGRLLCHLEHGADSAQFEDIEKIQLSKLNRNSAILIDSDKGAADGKISAAKQRIADEFEESKKNNCNSLVWITAGREIENYIHPDIVKRVLKTDSEWNKFSDIEDVAGKMAKLDIARAVTHEPLKYHLDLKDQLGELVSFIDNANSIK